jgi:transcription initiation factor TFIIF subunit alpha
MKFDPKRLVNRAQFTTPILLHRRDPQGPLQGVREQMLNAGLASESTDADPKDPTLNQKQRKATDDFYKQNGEVKKLDRKKRKATDDISRQDGAVKKLEKDTDWKYPTLNRKKRKATEKVYRQDEEAKKLRYERELPWFVEDFDNKNTWQGQIENNLSNGPYAAFVLEDGTFRMVPIQNYYKFTEKNKFKPLSVEEAEKIMKNAKHTPR